MIGKLSSRLKLFTKQVLPDSLPSPLVYPLTDNARLVQMLAEITGKPTDVVRQILYQGEIHIACYANDEFHRRKLTPYVWSEGLASYYTETDGFLLNSIVWNRNPHKVALRRWIGEYLAHNITGRLKILMYGDGPGFDSLYLAQCGHDITYFEVSDYQVNFARRLFAASGYPVQTLQDEQLIPAHFYDIVICLDVLEHVPDPPAQVGQLIRFLRPGGRLIVHAPFYLIAPRVPTHLKSNLKYSGSLELFTRHGLRLLDGRLFWFPLVLIKAEPGVRLPTSPWRRSLIRLSGLPFLMARFWRAPLVWYCQRIWNNTPRWIEGLEPPSENP